MELLPQQQHIIQEALAGHNLQILALAGCGKTTTSLAMAQTLFSEQGKRTLLLSYNKTLQMDTYERAKALHMTAFCDVKTIHSAYGFYAGQRVCKDDEQLKRLMDSNPVIAPVDADTVIIDECQDLSTLLYVAIHQLLRSAVETNQRVQIIILGDILQRIYHFRNARAEYIMYPDQYFNVTGEHRPFKTCRLSVNFRCSKKILDYVNRLMNPECLRNNPHYKHWFAQNEGIIMNAWGVGLEPCARALSEDAAGLCPDVKEVFIPKKRRYSQLIEMYHDVKAELGSHWEQKHRYEEISFIGVTYKGRTDLGCLATELGKRYNIHFSGDNCSNPKIKRNKLQFSTICKMKGRENHHVKVFAPMSFTENQNLASQKGTNVGYYDPTATFNTLYVALTRAQKTMTVYWIGEKPSCILDGLFVEQPAAQKSKYSVTELCEHSDENYEPLKLENICTVTDQSMPCVQEFFKEPESRVFQGRIFHNRRTVEDYAPVIGLAVELGIANQLHLLAPQLQAMLADIKNHLNMCTNCEFCNPTPCGLGRDTWLAYCEQLEPFVRAPHTKVENWSLLLQLAVYKFGVSPGCNQQLIRQLVGAHRIPPDALDACVSRGVDIVNRIAAQHETDLNKSMRYQVTLEKYTSLGLVKGVADCIIGSTVVEIKVTCNVATEHIMQALLYSALSDNLGVCYVVAPNLGKVLRVEPLSHITSSFLLEHAIRRKLGL